MSAKASNVWSVFRRIPIVLWFILLLVIIFSCLSKQYLTMRNLLILLQQGSVQLVVAAAATFVIISGGLDLSLGGILTLSGVTVAISLNAGLPIPVVILVGMLTGLLCGAINGVLISYCDLESFIVTLGTQGLFFGLSLVATKKVGISVSNESFIFLGSLYNKVIPMAAICCLIIYIFAIITQDWTRFGRYIFAIGGNAEGARLSGIDTKFWRCFTYAFAGFLTGLAAVILVARLEVADPLVGRQWEFEAIAAAILGGTSLRIGKGDVKGTIVGVTLLTVIRSGLNVARIPSLWQPAILGIVIIMAIVFQVSIMSKELKK
ncbi:MAG: ABC transporter permease [Bacillota bacterium]